MSWQGKQMPAYPRASARGLRPLRNRTDIEGRVAGITDLEPSVWKDALVTVLTSGCGLLLSPTSDGGALSVTLYYGDDRAKDYAASSEELSDVLAAATDQAQAYELARTSIVKTKGPSKP